MTKIAISVICIMKKGTVVIRLIKSNDNKLNFTKYRLRRFIVVLLSIEYVFLEAECFFDILFCKVVINDVTNILRLFDVPYLLLSLFYQSHLWLVFSAKSNL